MFPVLRAGEGDLFNESDSCSIIGLGIDEDEPAVVLMAFIGVDKQGAAQLYGHLSQLVELTLLSGVRIFSRANSLDLYQHPAGVVLKQVFSSGSQGFGIH